MRRKSFRGVTTGTTEAVAHGLLVIDPECLVEDGREPQPTDGPDFHADHAAWQVTSVTADDSGLRVELTHPRDICRMCRKPVRVMVFRGTGYCSQRCQEAPF